MIEVICHGVMLVLDVSAWPGSVSSLSLLVVSSISICDLPASNLEPYMFRISMVDGSSCEARCVCESVEDILRDSLVERKKCLCLDAKKQLRQKLAKSWVAEEVRLEASESRGRSDARPS